MPPADRYDVLISTPTFEPQAFEPQTPDNRQLSVLIDRAAVNPVGTVSQTDIEARSESPRMARLARP